MLPRALDDASMQKLSDAFWALIPNRPAWSKYSVILDSFSFTGDPLRYALVLVPTLSVGGYVLLQLAIDPQSSLVLGYSLLSDAFDAALSSDEPSPVSLQGIVVE